MLVHRPVDLVQLAVHLEDVGRHHVGQVVVRHDLHRRVVAPLVRIADLLDHRVQLFNRLLLGRRGHPVHLADVLLQRFADAVGQLQRLGLALRREGDLHILLSQRLAQVRVGRANAAPPLRQHLGNAAQRGAEEIEVRLLQLRSRLVCRRLDRPPAQVALQLVERARLDLLVERREKLQRGSRCRTEASGAPLSFRYSSMSKSGSAAWICASDCL